MGARTENQSDPVKQEVSLPMVGWNGIVFKVPSAPNHSVTLQQNKKGGSLASSLLQKVRYTMKM